MAETRENKSIVTIVRKEGSYHRKFPSLGNKYGRPYHAETEAELVVMDQARFINGKTVLITGVSLCSLSFTFIDAILSCRPGPSMIILASRNLKSVCDVIDKLHRTYPNAPLRALLLDLSSIARIRSAARELLHDKEIPQIDVLINNAVVMSEKLSRTADGFELTFGVAHLGHFLFTRLIWKKVYSARIVNVTAEHHRMSGIRWGDQNYEIRPRDYEKWEAYAQAKTANILFTAGLVARGIRAVSCCPGGVRGTGLEATGKPAQLEQKLGFRLNWKSPDVAVSSIIIAAFHPLLQGPYNGAYIEKCQIKMPAHHATGETPLESLWQYSEILTGEKFDALTDRHINEKINDGWDNWNEENE